MARSFQRPLPPVEPGQSPVNAVPPAILLVFFAIAGIEAALALGAQGTLGGPAAVGWRVMLMERFAVSGAVLEHAAMGDAGLWPRFLLYALVHGGTVHAIFAGVLLLALGKFVAEGMGQARAMAVLLGATVLGGLGYALAVGGTRPLFGAYPGVYGLIGAFTYLTWLKLGRMGENRLQAFRLIGVLLGLQLVFGALFGASPHWVGDVAGFLAGGVVAVLVAPGGLAALRARLRAR